MQLGVKVIHCSERDTQITDQPKEVDEFVNTWSVEGFREEGTTTAEMGWGTHEKELPPFAFEHADRPEEPDLPGPHGHEHLRFELGARITTSSAWWSATARRSASPKNSRSGTNGRDHLPAHRPLCLLPLRLRHRLASHELRGYDYRLQPRIRIMTDEITSGSDILGALVMGHPLNSWWCGSDLSIEESRRLVPHQNATTMQVAIAVVAACMWMIENPAPGRVRARRPAARLRARDQQAVPRQVHLDALRLDAAEALLQLLRGYNRPQLDTSDPWQFKNFLITDGD